MSPSDPGTVDPRILRTRDAVVAAAAELLATEGIGRLTIDAIAQKSGVARSTVYRNWPERADLLLAAFESVARLGCALTSLDCPGDHADDEPCSARPATTVGELRRVMTEHGLRMTMMGHTPLGSTMASIVAEAKHDPAIAEALARFGAVRRAPLEATARQVVVAAGVPEGEFLTPELAVERFVAPHFYRFLITGDPLDAVMVERQVELFLRDLGLT